MRQLPGKIIIFFLLSLPLLSQELAEYSLTTNKTNPYIKEAVEIIFKVHQKNKKDVMFFFLNPKKSANYKITLLKKETKDIAYHEKEASFYYLLFPLKSGDITLDFNFTIKSASDDAVAQVYTGSRDNVKWIETDDTNITLKPLHLNVKALTKEPILVGDFTLTSQLDKKEINAYENINLKYHLKGKGFNEFQLNLLTKTNTIEVFKDIHTKKNRATKDGYIVQKEFNYAIVAKKSFTIASQEILCFSPEKKSYYTLKTPAYSIKVTQTQTSKLLDKEEYPKEEETLLKSFNNLFAYIAVFLAGFFCGKIKFPQKREKEKERFRDVKESKNAKELLFILLHNYPHKDFKSECSILEEIVYNKKDKKRFSKIKKEILSHLEGS